MTAEQRKENLVYKNEFKDIGLSILAKTKKMAQQKLLIEGFGQPLDILLIFVALFGDCFKSTLIWME